MATVIDSLVVELGLDPSRFTAGQKKALDEFKKTQDEARRRAQEVEQQGRRTQQFFSGLQREAIGLFAAFAGAKGIKDFVAGVVQGDAAVGRFSRSVGMSASEIAKWQNVAKLVGGTAEGMAGSILSLKDQIFTKMTGGGGEISAIFAAIEGQGGHALNILMPFNQMLTALSANLEAIEKKRPGDAGSLVRKLGLDDTMFQTLIRGPSFLARAVSDAEKFGHATEDDVRQAEKLLRTWNEISITVENLGRRVFNETADSLKNVEKDAVLGPIYSGLTALSGAYWKMMGGFPGAPGETAPAGSGGAAGGVRSKAGAGLFSRGTAGLASILSGIEGFEQVTAADDAYHKGRRSLHNQGRALDFTIKDKSKSAAIAAAVRARLSELGIAANVLDEYLHPSAGSTGGHIHVGLLNAAAASAAARQGAGSSSTASTHIEINGPVTVTTQATDAAGLAAGLQEGLLALGQRRLLGTTASNGAQ